MTMTSRGSGLRITLVFLCFLCAPGLLGAQSQPMSTAERAAALGMFTERIESYVTLRDRLEAPLPSMKSKRDTWSGFLVSRYLAAAIASARSRARQGNIFTPATGRLFRDLIGEMGAYRDEEGRIDGLDIDSIPQVMVPAVNEPMPAAATGLLPPRLLTLLPPLPADIEYRLVGTHLVLWDARAEIVIDVLTDAFAIGFHV
jgi:hypothetical protein